jgi:hypothetical protein
MVLHSESCCFVFGNPSFGSQKEPYLFGFSRTTYPAGQERSPCWLASPWCFFFLIRTIESQRRLALSALKGADKKPAIATEWNGLASEIATTNRREIARRLKHRIRHLLCVAVTEVFEHDRGAAAESVAQT